jgi:hypothetical protein
MADDSTKATRRSDGYDNDQRLSPPAGDDDREQSTGLEDTTLNPGLPRPWHAPMTAVSFRLWRQILGLNPFKGSYFGLYHSLESTRDKLTALCAAVLAIAAGVPLPIIVSRRHKTTAVSMAKLVYSAGCHLRRDH